MEWEEIAEAMMGEIRRLRSVVSELNRTVDRMNDMLFQVIEHARAEAQKDFHDAEGSHEYTDYLSCPNRRNASEFITQVIENNIDRVGSRKNYVDYVANRPRVEKLGAHGHARDDREQ